VRLAGGTSPAAKCQQQGKAQLLTTTLCCTGVQTSVFFNEHIHETTHYVRDKRPSISECAKERYEQKIAPVTQETHQTNK
jgi:hypothetical protein